jgi:hypothetical protein
MATAGELVLGFPDQAPHFCPFQDDSNVVGGLSLDTLLEVSVESWRGVVNVAVGADADPAASSEESRYAFDAAEGCPCLLVPEQQHEPSWTQLVNDELAATGRRWRTDA